MQTRTTGFVLLIIGALMMIYTGFNYFTTEKVVDLGVVEINHQEKHPVQWSPIVGALLLVGGVVVIATGKKASA